MSLSFFSGPRPAELMGSRGDITVPRECGPLEAR